MSNEITYSVKIPRAILMKEGDLCFDGGIYQKTEGPGGSVTVEVRATSNAKEAVLLALCDAMDVLHDDGVPAVRGASMSLRYDHGMPCVPPIVVRWDDFGEGCCEEFYVPDLLHSIISTCLTPLWETALEDYELELLLV